MNFAKLPEVVVWASADVVSGAGNLYYPWLLSAATNHRSSSRLQLPPLISSDMIQLFSPLDCQDLRYRWSPNLLPLPIPYITNELKNTISKSLLQGYNVENPKLGSTLHLICKALTDKLGLPPLYSVILLSSVAEDSTICHLRRHFTVPKSWSRLNRKSNKEQTMTSPLTISI
jgi:hypothetical protein